MGRGRSLQPPPRTPSFPKHRLLPLERVARPIRPQDRNNRINVDITAEGTRIAERLYRNTITVTHGSLFVKSGRLKRTTAVDQGMGCFYRAHFTARSGRFALLQ
jgi:hypothetical protein